MQAEARAKQTHKLPNSCRRRASRSWFGFASVNPWLLTPRMRTFHTQHYANLRPSSCARIYLDGSPKTQRTYCVGDFGRIFLIGISPPAGMADRNMLNRVPRTLGGSNIAQCDHLSSLKLKASYLIKRASDCGL